jgi:hypothetical protein
VVVPDPETTGREENDRRGDPDWTLAYAHRVPRKKEGADSSTLALATLTQGPGAVKVKGARRASDLSL